MNNPDSLIGLNVSRNGISFVIEATTISRGKQSGEPRYVVSPNGANLATIITFLGEDVAKDALESVIRRASLDAHLACDVETKDKDGTTKRTFEEENYEANFIASLEGSAGEGEKALRDQRDVLNNQYREVTASLLAAIANSTTSGETVDVAAFNDKLAPLAKRIQDLDQQIASKVAAREAKKNK